MNKLSIKDYLIIYLVILIIVSFIAGFFIGARTMDNELNNHYNYTSSDETEEDNLEKEISTFYYQIYQTARSYNMDVNEFLNNKELINEADKEIIINSGKEIIENNKLYTFKSSDLTKSKSDLYMNINLLFEALNNSSTKETTESLDYYLSSQKEFYHALWIWDQSLESRTRIVEDSPSDWKAWNKGNLHQKNYIVSAILEQNSIKTFHKPEDITVHIDSYIKNEKEVTISLEDVVRLLISSDSINEKDFTKYTSKYTDWYSSDKKPEIPNFY